MSTIRMFFPAVPLLVARRTKLERSQMVGPMVELDISTDKQEQSMAARDHLIDIILANKAIALLMASITGTYVLPNLSDPFFVPSPEEARARASAVIKHIIATCVARGFVKEHQKIIGTCDPQVYRYLTMEDYPELREYNIRLVSELHNDVRGKILFTFVNRERDDVFPSKDAFGNLIIGNMVSKETPIPHRDEVRHILPYRFTSHVNHPLFCLCV